MIGHILQTVLKLRFDQGILGLFKFVDGDLPGSLNAPSDLDADFRVVIEMVNRDLLA